MRLDTELKRKQILKMFLSRQAKGLYPNDMQYKELSLSERQWLASRVI